MRVAIISDTHNLLRPQTLAFVRAADHIVHAGDICNAAVLTELASIASVTAVRGNNDSGVWASALNETELIRLGDVQLYVIHDLGDLRIDPEAAGVHIVVSGHSHRPVIDRRGPVLYINPGSAGPRRFRLPIAAVELEIGGGTVSARIVEFDVDKPVPQHRWSAAVTHKVLS